MAKSTVNSIVSKIKRRSDYDVSDTDLETLIIDIINDGLKVLKQLFLDYSFLDEISAHDTFSTVANQEYVDIATETIDLDQHISLSERTNDNVVVIIPFEEYRKRYPDPSADKSATPDVAAFFANRLYLGPTPSGVITLYLDYIKLISEVVAGGTMLFENQFDPLIIAMAKAELTEWLDPKNGNAITAANNRVEILKQELIIGASNNIGMNRQVHSRRNEIPYFSPRMVK